VHLKAGLALLMGRLGAAFGADAQTAGSWPETATPATTPAGAAPAAETTASASFGLDHAKLSLWGLQVPGCLTLHN